MKIARLFAVIGSFTLAAPATLFGQAAKPADPQAQPKITFDEHIAPIFREHCLSCHNQNEAKSDLALDTYARVMAGGASGEVVVPGDLESSRLYALTAHVESPKMPPAQDRIADEKIELLKKWVLGGALENNGSKAKIKPKVDLQLTVTANNKPSGPPAMPEVFRRQPFSHAARAGSVTALAASPWAPLVAVAGQKQIVLYNSDTTELVTILAYPEGLPYVLKFSRDGSVLMAGGGRGGASGKVVLFDVKTGKRITEIGDELDAVLAADVTNDLSLVALGGPKRIVRVYNVSDGSLAYELKKHTDWVTALEFSPDGTLLATADRSAGLLIWEAAAGREYQNLTGHTAAITDVSWRADSKFLVSCGEDASVKVWTIDNGKMVKSWTAHKGVLTARFGMDGNIVTGGRDKKAKVWTVEGNSVAETLEYKDMVLKAVLNWDGKRAIVGDWSGMCNIVDAKTGKIVGELNANPLPLAERVGYAAKRAEELKQAAAAAAADAVDFRRVVENLKQAERTAYAKSEQVTNDIKRFEEAKPKYERELPVKRQKAKDAVTKYEEIRGKLAEAEKSTKSLAADLAKKPDSPNAKKQYELAAERVKNLKVALADAETNVKTKADEAKKHEQELNQMAKDLPNLRNQVKPVKAALEAAVKERLDAETRQQAKDAVAKQTAEAAAIGEREAAQAAADKAEFDKLGEPQASATK